MNKKGFVLMETLVVTVFVMFIFTVLYNSVVPLLGKYTELSYYDDLDTTYDLYHLGKLLRYATNSEEIVNTHYKILKCQDIENEKCDSLFEFLNIDNTMDEVIFLNMEYKDELENDREVSNFVKDYLQYINAEGNIIIFQNDGYVSYMKYRGMPTEPIVTFSISGESYSSGYKKGAVVTVTCESEDGIAVFNASETSGSTGSLLINEDNKKQRAITLNNAGSSRRISVSCTTNYDLTTNISKSYRVYEYSRDSSCGVASYNYHGSYTCCNSSGSACDEYTCNAARYPYTALSYCRDMGYSGATSGTCYRTVSRYNSCWHT